MEKKQGERRNSHDVGHVEKGIFAPFTILEVVIGKHACFVWEIHDGDCGVEGLVFDDVLRQGVESIVFGIVCSVVGHLGGQSGEQLCACGAVCILEGLAVSRAIALFVEHASEHRRVHWTFRRGYNPFGRRVWRCGRGPLDDCCANVREMHHHACPQRSAVVVFHQAVLLDLVFGLVVYSRLEGVHVKVVGAEDNVRFVADVVSGVVTFPSVASVAKVHGVIASYMDVGIDSTILSVEYSVVCCSLQILGNHVGVVSSYRGAKELSSWLRGGVKRRSSGKQGNHLGEAIADVVNLGQVTALAAGQGGREGRADMRLLFADNSIWGCVGVCKDEAKEYGREAVERDECEHVAQGVGSDAVDRYFRMMLWRCMSMEVLPIFGF